MKKLLMIALFFASFCANAQVDKMKINDYVVGDALTGKVDTLSFISFKGDGFDITRNETKINYQIMFFDKRGNFAFEKKITYDDLIRAATKAGLPLSTAAAFVQGVEQKMVVGTFAEKIAALNSLLASYKMVIKPDKDQ